MHGVVVVVSGSGMVHTWWWSSYLRGGGGGHIHGEVVIHVSLVLTHQCFKWPRSQFRHLLDAASERR
jgi:hypothetical protein